ncbi:MAG TPA: PhoH family protein, partial [Nocardiopsis listeri]|nr:PhoH family protein [Nocardiopsis listeri]
DVVRHKLVGQIVDAYGRYDAAQSRHGGETGGARPRRGRRPVGDTREEDVSGGGPERAD